MGRLLGAGAASLSIAAAISFTPSGREANPARFPQPRTTESAAVISDSAVRTFALEHAQVWQPVDPRTIDLASNPPDPSGMLSLPLVRCRFIPQPARGTTPKFDCELPDGEIVKVKYGRTGEVPAELAATRLLTALGFGTDRMYLAPALRCYGCPRYPFYLMWAADRVGAFHAVSSWPSMDRYTDFRWAVVERRFPGMEVRDDDHEGWAWYELRANEDAPRAHLDALRLAAMLLAHWDNKAENQRLVCRAASDRSDDSDVSDHVCGRPFAIVHDLGATFGPNKVDRDAWAAAPIWRDPSRCIVSMTTFPYNGSTFVDAQISEGGRQLLLAQLRGLDATRLTTLFRSARFDQPEAWTRTFMWKVQQIAAARTCD